MSPGNSGSPRTVLAVMCAGYFLVLLDVTVVNVALPAIGSDLGTDVGGLGGTPSGGGRRRIRAGARLPRATSGAAGDRYGHKRVVLTGLGVFGAGSLACGLAQSGGCSWPPGWSRA
ncbi:hypothetical protein ACWGJ6_19350, partial [Streptomyces canus]